MALIKNANSRTMARDAVVLDLGDLSAQGEHIKREALAAAHRIIADARAQRETIIAGGREEGFSAGKAEGFERGREDGRKAGRDEAFRAHDETLRGLERSWTEALGRFEAERDALLGEARVSLLRLVGELASRVTQRHVQADAYVVTAQLEAALKLVLQPTRLRVEVNPDDLEAAKQAFPELMARFGPGAHADVTASPALARGSCVVRTDMGEIDASIGTQLARATAALMGDETDAARAGATP